MSVLRSARYQMILATLSALVVVVVLVPEIGAAAPSGPVMARQKDQLSTCLNLATGITRVLMREACDPVTEMLHVWAATVEQESVRRAFSAKTEPP